MPEPQRECVGQSNAGAAKLCQAKPNGVESIENAGPDYMQSFAAEASSSSAVIKVNIGTFWAR